MTTLPWFHSTSSQIWAFRLIKYLNLWLNDNYGELELEGIAEIILFKYSFTNKKIDIQLG